MNNLHFACLFCFFLCCPVIAEESPAPTDRQTLDRHLHDALREVINRGADYYNLGDPAACYHLYRGSLLMLRPVLDHRPNLQKTIADALAEAEQLPEMRKRAWTLRTVLNTVRNALKTEASKVDESPKVEDSKRVKDEIKEEK